MSTLAVQLASGQEVVSDFFLDADSTIGELADAAGAQLAVASSRCVLLSPSGDCMAHSLTASATALADGDVITVLVMVPSTGIRAPKKLGLRCSETRQFRCHVEARRSSGNYNKVKSELTRVVGHVVGTSQAFAALKEDGSVVTWGHAASGGNSNDPRNQLTGGVRHVVGNVRVFAEVKEDGSVVTWESPYHGGDSETVTSELSGVLQMKANLTA